MLSAMLVIGVTASATTARAWTVEDAIKALNWCSSDRNEPGHGSDEYLTKLPDGSQRGPESAHGLLQRAKIFASKGKNELAVDMAAACQAHRKDQKQAILEHPAEVISYLESFK
jgi:hypothetical protein